jgi:hypothetical protein
MPGLSRWKEGAKEMNNSIKFKEQKLGTEAVVYIKKCLSAGNTLAKYLLKTVTFENGYVTTMLPAGILAKDTTDFEEGIFPRHLEAEISTASDQPKTVCLPAPDMDFYLASVIEEFLNASENHVCILEDALFRPGDLILLKRKQKPIILGDEVYYFFQGKGVSIGDIADMIKQVKSIPIFVGAMASLPEGRTLEKPNAVLTSEEIAFVAKNVEKIFVGAYDGEGNLIWHKGI